MRICFVVDGTSEHARRIANDFAQKGHDVHVIGRLFLEGYDTRVNKHNVKCLFPKKGLYDYINFLFQIPQAKRLVAEIKPDILNAHYVTTYGLLAAITGFHPLVVTAWGSDMLIWARRNLVWKSITKYVLSRADLLTCLFDVSMLYDKNGTLVPPNLATASLPYGVDVDLFHKKQGDFRIRQFYHIEPDDPIIINVRGFDPIYDPGTFLRVIPSVINQFPSARFLITAHHHEQKISYEEIVKKQNINNNVIITDFMSSNEIAEHLGEADIYVSTSLSDGASNALFEGMACELPPVVTDIPANRAWIKDGENGFLFKPGNYTELAEKIIYLLNDKKKRVLFGKKCREIVKEKAEYRVQMAKTEKIYQDLVDSRSRG